MRAPSANSSSIATDQSSVGRSNVVPAPEAVQDRLQRSVLSSELLIHRFNLSLARLGVEALALLLVKVLRPLVCSPSTVGFAGGSQQCPLCRTISSFNFALILSHSSCERGPASHEALNLGERSTRLNLPNAHPQTTSASDRATAPDRAGLAYGFKAPPTCSVPRLTSASLRTSRGREQLRLRVAFPPESDNRWRRSASPHGQATPSSPRVAVPADRDATCVGGWLGSRP
jgi:hypothetical protein